MDIIRLTVGPLATNCYLVYSFLEKGLGKEGIVIDPGGDCGDVLQIVRRRNIRVKAVVNTHGHSDHIYCNEVLKMGLGCEVWMSEAAAEIAGDREKNLSEVTRMEVSFSGVDRFLKEGDRVRIGNEKLRVMSLPGHSPGGIGLVARRKKIAFLGDLVFETGQGRTDLFGGDSKALDKSLDSVRKKLLPGTVIYPGHMDCFSLSTG